MKPYKEIAANSQMVRLLENNISYKLFDYYYFKYDLGKIGINKLKELEVLNNFKHKDASVIRKKAEMVLRDQSLFWQHIVKGVELSNIFRLE